MILPVITKNMSDDELDELANKAAENIVLKPKVEPLTVERLKEMGSTVKRKTIIEGIDNKYPILEVMKNAKVNTKTGIEIMGLFQKLNSSGITIIIITHEYDVAQFANRILRFKDGEIVDEEINTQRIDAEALLKNYGNTQPKKVNIA